MPDDVLFTFKSVLTLKSFTYFLLVLCIILILLICIQYERIPMHSIIFHDKNIQYGLLTGVNNCLNEYVKNIQIIKTSINMLLYKFSKNYFCHWAILVTTVKNNMCMISPTGNGGVDVHEVLHEYIHYKDNHKFLKGGSLGKYYIYPKKYIPKYLITVNDIVLNLFKANSTIDYMMFTMNCQYIISYTLSLFVDGINIPNISPLTSFVRVCKDFMFSDKFNSID